MNGDTGSLPRSVVGQSVVCDCGILRSYAI